MLITYLYTNTFPASFLMRYNNKATNPKIKFITSKRKSSERAIRDVLVYIEPERPT